MRLEIVGYILQDSGYKDVVSFTSDNHVLCFLYETHANILFEIWAAWNQCETMSMVRWLLLKTLEGVEEVGEGKVEWDGGGGGWLG